MASRYQQIAEQLRAQIRTGALLAGDPLPSEEVLAEEHRVSRPTVRSAVAQLREEGLVFTVNGRGSFVRSPEQLRRLAGELLAAAEAMERAADGGAAGA